MQVGGGWSVPSEKSSREGKRSAMSLNEYLLFFKGKCKEAKNGKKIKAGPEKGGDVNGRQK